MLASRTTTEAKRSENANSSQVAADSTASRECVPSTPRLLTPKETARLLGVSVQTLAVWRCKNRYGLPYVRLGRLIKYRSDVIAAAQLHGVVDGVFK
jgi:hypothetical protein